jgi:hypothetical protein
VANLNWFVFLIPGPAESHLGTGETTIYSKPQHGYQAQSFIMLSFKWTRRFAVVSVVATGYGVKFYHDQRSTLISPLQLKAENSKPTPILATTPAPKPAQSQIIPRGIYSRLNDTKNEIRLLELLPGLKSQSLQCNLKVASLDDKPTYTALSYTWGEPIRRTASLWSYRGIFQYMRQLLWSLQGVFWKFCWSRPITIYVNGLPLVVSPNLVSALHYLRDSKKPLLLWADAVCINQKDPVEKGHQVKQMKNIYSGAETTCVWLGPSADGSDSAMDFIASSSSVDLTDPNLVTEEIPVTALKALLARSWWRRIWILQEVHLSNHVTIRCGTKETDLEQFRNLARKEAALYKYLITAESGPHKAGQQLRWTPIFVKIPFFEIFQFWDFNRDKEDTPLRVWMNLTNEFESSLLRDKVYGLLGISWLGNTPFQIDYSQESKPDREVFKDSMIHFLRTEGDLGAFQWAHLKHHIPGLPSWVPDPTAKHHPPNLKEGEGSADGDIQTWVRLSNGKLSPEHLAMSRATPIFIENNEILVLQGLPVGQIRFADRVPEHAFVRITDADVHTVEKWERVLMQHEYDPYSKTTGGKQEAFWRTLINNRTDLGVEDKIAPSNLEISFNLWMGRNPYSKERVKQMNLLDNGKGARMIREFNDDLRYGMQSRAFMITNKGLVGVGPAGTKKGDWVCVLRGGSLPLVLRPLGKGYWNLIGECYVHGIMNGDWAKAASEEQVTTFFLK